MSLEMLPSLHSLLRMTNVTFSNKSINFRYIFVIQNLVRKVLLKINLMMKLVDYLQEAYQGVVLEFRNAPKPSQFTLSD